MTRMVFLVVLALWGVGLASEFQGGPASEDRPDLFRGQLHSADIVPQEVAADFAQRQTAMVAGGALWVVLAGGLFSREILSLGIRGKGSEPTEKADFD